MDIAEPLEEICDPKRWERGLQGGERPKKGLTQGQKNPEAEIKHKGTQGRQKEHQDRRGVRKDPATGSRKGAERPGPTLEG